MDPEMMFNMMGGKGGGYHGGMGHRSMKPQSIAAPVDVTLLELYLGEGTKVMDMDDLANDEMRDMQVAGKYDVQIKPGHRPGSRIAFPGEGIEMPGVEGRGDLAAILELKEDDTPGFSIVNEDDLLSTLPITLPQALCGFSVEFKHIDGALLLLHHSKVCSPDDVLRVAGKGLPKEDESRGDLLLKLQIAFPRVLEEDQVSGVRPLLASRSMIALYDEEPEIHRDFDDVSPEEWKAKIDGENDSDDEDEGPRVACAHQ
eukprot:TRINITY_DN52601_c0_g1_i1.p1 TRINITY_DN52601_c0_g1~~TRINITY_DN52601_c0_g1_i1.p1  ORF type:complete len:258 (+),score=104.34 TRINITY_DN52601_c0_g1_i1:111-884(+)